MHKYRTNTCGEINETFIDKQIKLSGWINSKRDHGGLVFIDLRDHYGITQCVIDTTHKDFPKLEHLRIESVITVEGTVVKRRPETINENLSSGKVELKIENVNIISSCDVLPILVATDEQFPEDLRLKYRYIDLRRTKLQKTLILRSKIIKAMRDYMWEQGFNELQTPILTSSSPEGARDFLVPSRVHAGKFYALPQAPQQFKQLAMVAGFDKYFQVAPCFRDEDTRADRVLEFYQLDMEMSFATQEDVLTIAKGLVENTFSKFAGNRKLSEWTTIPYNDAMEKYGSDKPDLRNPLIICDTTEVFKDSEFTIFKDSINNNKAVVKTICTKGTSSKPRSWFDGLNNWAKENKAKGLGYIVFDENGEAKGPIAKNLKPSEIEKIKTITGATNTDSVFFICDKLRSAQKFAGLTRIKLGTDLDLLEKDIFKFAFIVDFPFYELDDATSKIDFGHNPFSMPQTSIKDLSKEELLKVKAYQYDIVCNGYETASGAVRNYDIETMIKAFENVGYTKEDVEKRFSGLMTAFKYGVPPHAGIALGIDRIIMLLADEPNLREVILFPINGKGEDLMMAAPSVIPESQLRELHIKVDLDTKK